MLPLTSGGGLRPAAPQLAPQPWPSEAFSRYLRAHSEFREALLEGRQLPDSRVLIYACTSMTFCGGHGDRLNGMLSAAVVALLSGRLFFVDSQRPVPLSLVLEPNRWDWQLHGTIAALPAGINLNDKLATFEADPRWLLDNQASVLRLVSNQRLTSAARVCICVWGHLWASSIKRRSGDRKHGPEVRRGAAGVGVHELGCGRKSVVQAPFDAEKPTDKVPGPAREVGFAT